MISSRKPNNADGMPERFHQLIFSDAYYRLCFTL
ncbi:hypothetical protein PM8797T_24241 [Gimesia maris DSM 8797]|nr:hypothetical protein PM8797T_24241 [Gimesia maris DSM 8797]